MRHFTCDKCGMPMEHQLTMTIDNRLYEICGDCQNKILKGLEGKGERVLSPQEIKLREEFPHDRYKEKHI